MSVKINGKRMGFSLIETILCGRTDSMSLNLCEKHFVSSNNIQ